MFKNCDKCLVLVFIESSQQYSEVDIVISILWMITFGLSKPQYKTESYSSGKVFLMKLFKSTFLFYCQIHLSQLFFLSQFSISLIIKNNGGFMTFYD